MPSNVAPYFASPYFSSPYFGGAYWGRITVTSPGPGAPAAGDLFAALRTYLRSLPGLAALTDVYRLSPGRQSVTNWPYLVMSPIDSPTDTLLQGGIQVERYEVQFTVVGTDDLAVEDIGKAAYQALSPFSGTTLRWLDGSEALRQPVFRGRLAQQPGRAADNQDVFGYSFSYRIWVTTSLR